MHDERSYVRLADGGQVYLWARLSVLDTFPRVGVWRWVRLLDTRHAGGIVRRRVDSLT